MDRVETILMDAGHEVTRVSVDMAVRAHAVDDLPVPAEVWNAAPEYFAYVAARTRFDRLDTSRFDMVLSTQPPSFSHRHPRHLALFYHHHRVMKGTWRPVSPLIRACTELLRRRSERSTSRASKQSPTS